MAEEKWKRDLVEAAILQTEAYDESKAVYIKAPPAAKYRKRYKKDDDRPPIHVGMRIVASMTTGREVVGYALVVLLDYDTVETFFYDRVSFIGQVIAVTHEKLDEYVGRLVHVDGERNYWARGKWALQDWEWRRNYKWRDSDAPA